jgi:hypothetical protein
MSTSGLKTAPAPARPKIRRIQAVINPAAGSVGPDAEKIVAELISRHGYDLTIVKPSPDELASALQAAVGADPDLVLILAGDGTARLAAELCGPDGPLVAPMAGGTLNMLPHAIYGKQPASSALSAAGGSADTPSLSPPSWARPRSGPMPARRRGRTICGGPGTEPAMRSAAPSPAVSAMAWMARSPGAQPRPWR